MSITATEFKANLSKYLLMAATEDILITQYGKVVAKLTNPFQNRTAIAESLFGILPQTTTLDEARAVKLSPARGEQETQGEFLPSMPQPVVARFSETAPVSW